MQLHNVLRTIKGGQVSNTKDQVVEPAEVHHIYPIATKAADRKMAELCKLVDELRADRDAWKDQAQRLALRVPPLRR